MVKRPDPPSSPLPSDSEALPPGTPHTGVEPGAPPPPMGAQPAAQSREAQGHTLPSATVGTSIAPTIHYTGQGAAPPQLVSAATSGQFTQALRFPPPSMITLHGEVIEHAPPHRIRVRYPVEDAFLNPYGVLQGGFLAAMFDNVIGMSTYAVDPSRQSATLEMSVRFFRSLRAGHVVIDGSVLRAGHTTVTIECVAFDDASQLCAKAVATNIFLG